MDYQNLQQSCHLKFNLKKKILEKFKYISLINFSFEDVFLKKKFDHTLAFF